MALTESVGALELDNFDKSLRLLFFSSRFQSQHIAIVGALDKG